MSSRGASFSHLAGLRLSLSRRRVSRVLRVLRVLPLAAAFLPFFVAADAAAIPSRPGPVEQQPVVRTADAQNAEWLTHVFQDVLFRPIDAPALTTYRASLGKGSTRLQVASGILGSGEFRQHVVGELYGELLGRPADGGQSSFFVNTLAQGSTIDSVVATIIGSPEYFTHNGASTDGFTVAVYRDLMHRPVNADGKAFVANAITNNQTRTQIAQTLLASEEQRQALVATYYTRFLRRPADPAARAAWATSLAQGVRREAVIAAILASDEYYARH